MSRVDKAQDARERLTEAARKLFASKGFHSSAMSELAATAGVSVGQVYRLFESKDDIIVAIVETDAALRQIDLNALCDRFEGGAIDAETAFREFALLALSEKDEGLSFEILAEAHRNPRVSVRIARLCDEFRHAIRRLVRATRPHFSDAELDASEELLLACMFGLSHRRLSQPKLPREEAARQTGRMLIGALAALAGECRV